jgi:predicted nucleic acid-binding protein
MIIVDTGAFLALFNQRDTYHFQAQIAFNSISEPLISTYPVVTETCYMLTQFASDTASFNFLKSFCLGAFEIFDLEKYHVERMIQLMENYANLPMDLADTSLVVLAEHLENGRILTVDRRDFNIYRWHKTNSFENLFFSQS